MPKVTPSIPNDLILAHIGDKEKLSDNLWLIPPQLSMLLGRSIDQLEEDRKVGNPPPAMKPWGEKGPVRYKLGTVRDFMFGSASREYNNTEHARQEITKSKKHGLGFANFASFLAAARPTDVWPMTIHRGIPVDFFFSLGLDDALADEDRCEWMTLDDYLVRRRMSALPRDVMINGQAVVPAVLAALPPRTGAQSAELAPSPSELTTLAHFFCSGKAVSREIHVAGDPPFLGRSAHILRLAQQVAGFIGFNQERSAKITGEADHSQVQLQDEKMLGLFHELLAAHDPAQYLWYCQNWTKRLERTALEAARLQISQDSTGPIEVKTSSNESFNVRTRIGHLVEALAYKIHTLDAALIDEIFPGLSQAVALIYGMPDFEESEPNAAQRQSAIEKLVSLYTFLKAEKYTPVGSLPSLTESH